MQSKIHVGNYADFVTFVANHSSDVSVWYVDLTGSSGPFIIYNFPVGAAHNEQVVIVTLDSQPGSFTSDWTTRHQLKAPLDF